MPPSSASPAALSSTPRPTRQSEEPGSAATPSTADDDWPTQGRCRTEAIPTRVFYPDDWRGTIRAKAICAECPVRRSCLEAALGRREDWGVWGGTSERERRRLLQARSAARR